MCVGLSFYLVCSTQIDVCEQMKWQLYYTLKCCKHGWFLQLSKCLIEYSSITIRLRYWTESILSRLSQYIYNRLACRMFQTLDLLQVMQQVKWPQIKCPFILWPFHFLHQLKKVQEPKRSASKPVMYYGNLLNIHMQTQSNIQMLPCANSYIVFTTSATYSVHNKFCK